jgi:hypothetical protein
MLTDDSFPVKGHEPFRPQRKACGRENAGALFYQVMHMQKGRQWRLWGLEFSPNGFAESLHDLSSHVR